MRKYRNEGCSSSSFSQALPLRGLRARIPEADSRPFADDDARIFPFERRKAVVSHPACWPLLPRLPAGACMQGYRKRNYRFGSWASFRFLSLAFLLHTLCLFFPDDWRLAHEARAIVATIPRRIRHESPVSRFRAVRPDAGAGQNALPRPRDFCAGEGGGRGSGEAAALLVINRVTERGG